MIRLHNELKERLLYWAEWICRLSVAGLFLYAAYPKLSDPVGFAKAIANYKVSLPIIGQNYVYMAAVFMPALEAVIGLGLLLNRSKRAASLLAAGLLMLFIVLILQAVLRGLNIDCGCFGSSPLSAAKASNVGWSKIGQNVFWTALSIFIYRRSGPKKPRYRL